jgi:2-keto-4-pentenoate hydratase
LEEEHRKGGLEAAYGIQESLQKLLIAGGCGAITGYKVALTSPAMQAFVGVDQPLAGAIFANRVHRSPALLDARTFQRLGIECEIAVRLAAGLPHRAEGHNVETVAPAIGAVMPAFELIEDRNADYDAIDAFSLVADNCWNAGIVLGDPVEDWRAIDLCGLRGALHADGVTIGEGKGADALGHPLAAVAWLADLLALRGHTLERGMVVMTGSIVKTYFPVPGEQLVFSADGIGDVALRLGGG